MNCLIELHYLPSTAYVALLSHSNEIIIERHEHFIKQSYRNRCHILGANRIEKLIIPITSKHADKQGKVAITDVKIDYSQKWLSNHWRTIESAYRKAPYYDHYADELKRILNKRHSFLYNLNMELLTTCLTWLNITKPVRESQRYEIHPGASVHDFRNRIHPKADLAPEFFKPAPYTQVFGHSFVPNLSILDLIFCEGPGAGQTIKDSAG